MAKLKKIGVLFLAKLLAIIMTIAGLIAGVLYSFGGLAIDTLVSIGWISSETASTPGLSYGTFLAFGALIGMPVIFALFGFIAGIIGAFFYNITSKWHGGIDIDIEQ